MLTIRITVAAIGLFIQASQCLASNDSPFMLTNKATSLCLMRKSTHCYELRWTSDDRIFITRLKKCLGAQGKSVGSEISIYDCDEKSAIQKWECKNQTLLALKGENLFIQRDGEAAPVLSREAGPNCHFTISGTSNGACSRTHRELYSIGGNAFGKPCMFPFQYKDRWFADCTTYDSSVRRAWCAVETKFDHQLWGYCPSTTTDHWKANPVTGVHYQINSQSTLTWHQAKMSCEQQGATLLSIIDPHEQSYIIGVLGAEHFRLWIGLILDHEHGWQWTDGRPFRYLRWDSGHPLPDPGHNCAVVDSAVQYSWQSSLCTKRMGYICHKGGTSPPLDPVETGFCSNPWIPYNGHCFNLQRTKKTWSEAQQECRKEGGDLASIHNIEDQSFVISQLGYATSDELWIGLNDRRTEGLFDWSEHSTVTFTSWEFGNPRPFGALEDCVIITGENGNWADHVCTEKHGFICMKTSASQPSGDQVEVDVGCKPGWRRHGSYCYLVGSETKTFAEAKELCKSSESYLADVSTGVDNAFLVSLVGMRPEKYFWLGLSNQRNIDNFMWTNTNVVKFTHWNAEMPGSRQGCVAMTTGILAGLWDVLPCTDQVKYICKHLAEGAVLTPAPPTPAPPSCAEGWEPVATRNYCFKFFTGPRADEKTWFEARDYCLAIGGDLLSIHNTIDLRVGGHGKAWIGLSIPEPNNGWVWSDGSPVNFLHWMDGEPNNKWSVESCAEFRMYNRDDSGSWNDVHCESYNDWLCQIRAGVTPKPPPNNTVTDMNVTSDGWLVWRENQYYLNRNRMAMEDARHFCQQRHGDIVVINSEAENVFLWKQISREYGFYYIGLTVDLDGTYGWMDGSPMAFERWDENQPDFKNNDENCVVMTHSMGFWHDNNCGREHRFICKRSGTPPVNTTVAPTVPPKGGCPIDWSLFDSKCYRVIQNQMDTWHEARRRCNGMGGNLVSVVSRRVQAYLITRMFKPAATDLWIGLTSLAGEEFCWTDGRARRYTNWGSGTRRNRYGHFYRRWNEEECVVMSSSPSIGIGKWVMKSCNDTNGYVCLQKVDPTILTSPEPATPNTYVKLGNDSFKVITQNLTWKDARKRCEADGAQLASLRTEWSEAYAEVQALSVKGPLWIGLNKNETEGYFRFIDGWHLSISKWGRDEPSRERPCVYLDVDGAWKTAFCNQTFNSICMQSTDVPPTMSTQYPGVCPEEVVTDQSEESIAWVPFKGHCYLFIAEEIEWADAASSCVRHGGILASIEDPSEQIFLNSYLKLFQDVHNSFWIGLFKTRKGQWKWLDKTVMDYTNWGDDELTNQPNDANCYGQIQSSDGKWSTGRQWHDRPYICKTAKVLRGNVLPTPAHQAGEPRHRVHTALSVVLVITGLSVLAVTAFFLYKKSGLPLPLPTFDNPLFFENERSQPDVVDTNKLIENAEEENSELIITL